MTFTDWLLVGGAALLLKKGLQKETADYDEQAAYIAYLQDYYAKMRADEKAIEEAREAEFNRLSAVNMKRKAMPCSFCDGLTSEMFNTFAHRAGKRIKRIKSVTVRDAVIRCNVESQTGYSNWDFYLDFNNWGHITGLYWMQTYNKDSSIPHHFGQMISGWIIEFYQENNITLMNLSYYVDRNSDLETNVGFNYNDRGKSKGLFGRKSRLQPRVLPITYGTNDLVGEHLYPVLSILKSTGFKNIKTFFSQDIDDSHPGYPFQVAQVLIDGSNFFESGMYCSETAEVLITYRGKKVIKMPFSPKELKHKNYDYVRELLNENGYTKVSEFQLKDLTTGWFVKEGSVENVLVRNDGTQPIEKNTTYDYDQEFVICYHMKKR